jgi:digeranylgeranylglycerophospholipid reductase
MVETDMKEEYDVIVVGAGPAGSIAALTAAEECDVLLIEKRQEIGTPVRCAEGVDKARFLKFIQPDKKWIASEFYGARIIAPDGTTLHLSGEAMGMEGEMGFILERKVFDRELAKNAARAGAHVMVRTRATGLIVENDAVQGVKLNRLGEDFEVRSKVVIGADGVESQVGRWGGINTTLKLKDTGTCVQYQITNVDKSTDTIDAYVGSAAPGAYAWVFPKGEREANIGLGVLASKLNGKRPVDYLNEFVSKNFPEGQPVELVMGAAPVSDELKTTIGNGLMLVGDAAHHCDPLTGSGITNAMEGGRIAGEVARKASRQNDSSSKVLKEYETRWHSSYGKMQTHSYKVKEFFVGLSDDEINRIVRALKGMRPPQEVSFVDVGRRLLMANPKLLFLMRHLVAMREIVLEQMGLPL